MEANIINVSPYKLKLCSKKLESGKYQVKFYATRGEDSQDMYGYVLAEAHDTLKRVVTTIKCRLNLMEESDEYYHTHLYSVRKTPLPTSDFLIFKQN